MKTKKEFDNVTTLGEIMDIIDNECEIQPEVRNLTILLPKKLYGKNINQTVTEKFRLDNFLKLIWVYKNVDYTSMYKEKLVSLVEENMNNEVYVENLSKRIDTFALSAKYFLSYSIYEIIENSRVGRGAINLMCTMDTTEMKEKLKIFVDTFERLNSGHMILASHINNSTLFEDYKLEETIPHLTVTNKHNMNKINLVMQNEDDAILTRLVGISKKTATLLSRKYGNELLRELIRREDEKQIKIKKSTINIANTIYSMIDEYIISGSMKPLVNLICDVDALDGGKKYIKLINTYYPDFKIENIYMNYKEDVDFNEDGYKAAILFNAMINQLDHVRFVTLISLLKYKTANRKLLQLAVGLLFRNDEVDSNILLRRILAIFNLLDNKQNPITETVAEMLLELPQSEFNSAYSRILLLNYNEQQ